MDGFGVRFAVNHPQRFEALRSLFAEIKQDKDSGEFREAAEWARLVPDEIKGRFSWPTLEEREHWLAVRDSTPIAIPAPSQQLGAKWDFYRVFEAIEESEYDVLGCEMVGKGIAEMRIDPHAYPHFPPSLTNWKPNSQRATSNKPRPVCWIGATPMDQESGISAEELAQRAFDAGLVSRAQLDSLWKELESRQVPLADFICAAVGHELLTHSQIARLQTGKRDGYFLGKYKLLYLLGTEPFARVYRAVQVDTHREVSVKVLRSRYRDDPAVRENFLREAKRFACETSVEGNDLYMVLDVGRN